MSAGKTWAALLLAGCLAAGAYAQEVKEPDPFAEATIRVKGFGKFPPGKEGTPAGKLAAIQAAKTIARRNIVLLFGNVEISGDERVKEIVAQGFVNGAREVGEPVVQGNMVIVTMEIPLSAIAGDMADLHGKIGEAKARNEQLEAALGKADSGLKAMSETLERLKKAVEDMEAKLKEGRK